MIYLRLVIRLIIAYYLINYIIIVHVCELLGQNVLHKLKKIVQCNDSKSDNETIKCGVPHIRTNASITLCVRFIVFADDRNIFASIKNQNSDLIW